MKLYGFYLRKLIKEGSPINLDVKHPTDAEVILLEHQEDADNLNLDESGLCSLTNSYVKDILKRIDDVYGKERNALLDDGGYVIICHSVWEAEKFLKLNESIFDKAEGYERLKGFINFTLVMNNDFVITVLALEKL